MPYVGKEILCRKCLNEQLPEGELIDYLDSYVQSLPDDVRTDEETYHYRLSMCADCSNRYEATCRLCGCYCQARAAKKLQRCPIPDHPKWTEQSESENIETE